MNKSTEIRTNLRLSCLINKSSYAESFPQGDEHKLKHTKQNSGIESETHSLRFSSLLSCLRSTEIF